jgi:hypothetical protein
MTAKGSRFPLLPRAPCHAERLRHRGRQLEAGSEGLPR